MDIKPPLCGRVSSATPHICGVRVRHCNHSKGFRYDRRSSGRYKNILCARLVMAFLHQTINSLQSQTSHLPNTLPLQAFQLPSNLHNTYTQTTISSNPKYNGHRYVPTILLPLRRLGQCFHLLQEILRLKHPSSLHTRLPGLLRPPLPCICLLSGIGSSCWPPGLH